MSRVSSHDCDSPPEARGDQEVATHRVQVRFLGFLERLAGNRETLVEVEAESTVMDLLERLGERYGEEFRTGLFRTPGEVHTYLRIFLNNEETQPRDRITGDPQQTSKMELIILPIFEGGSR